MSVQTTEKAAPLFIVPTLLGRHQGDLREDMGGRQLLGNERQFQMADDPVQAGSSVVRKG
jgi:hypothetical protein